MRDPVLDLSDYSLISISAAAEILGISCKTARNWLSSNKFPIYTFRLGGRRMLRTQDLVRYVNQLTNFEPQSAEFVKSHEKNITVKKKGRPRKT